MFKKVFYNTLFQVAGKAFTASITLLVTILIGRSLGPALYGDFTKIFVYVGYFYTLADFGLNTIFIKIANAQNQVNLLKTLAALRLLMATVLAIVAVGTSLFLPYNEAASTGFSPLVKLGIVIAAFTIVTQALFTTANAFFQKNLRYELSALSAAVGYSLILILSLIFSKTAVSPLPYVFAYVLGGITFVVAAFILISKQIGQLPLPKLNLQTAKAFFPAWPVGVALIFNLVYFRIDVFILSTLRETVEVGYYGLAYQFFEAALAVPIFFANSIFPLLSRSYSKNIPLFKNQLKKWLILLTFISFCLSFVLFIISYLIPAIFGSRFAPATPALQILAAGVPFFFVSALLWHVQIIYNKQKNLIYIYGIGAVFNIVLNLLLIPTYGYIAAAAITVASEGLILALLIIASYKMITNSND